MGRGWYRLIVTLLDYVLLALIRFGNWKADHVRIRKMRTNPVQVEKYGAVVWSNQPMDALRKTECLCLNCARLHKCDAAWTFLGVCQRYDTAVMITRCRDWQRPKGKYEPAQPEP